jgi:hypothetical protein
MTDLTISKKINTNIDPDVDSTSAISQFRIYAFSQFHNFAFSHFRNFVPMNRKISLALLFCATLLIQMAACSPGTEHERREQKIVHLTPGKVIPRVTCLHDSSVSYALLLPENYDPAKRYPLIIAFDPHAAGKLPVDLFRREAERFGYIVAGSNNSKNGVAWNITAGQYEVMRRDLILRLSIDTSRIYTAGFSGGSRVAASIAIFSGGISGVIGCSAGFPQIDRPLTTTFSYLGVVGNADFNFTEMKALDKALESAGFVHHLLVFDGIHAWPPASLIPSLFTWLELDAIRRNLKPADAAFINGVKERYQHENDSLQRKNDIVGAYAKCLEASHFLTGVTDVGSFNLKAVQLSQTAEVKKQGEEDDRLAQKEIQLQQFYVDAMGTRSEEWWRVEVQRLNASPGKNVALAERTMYKRVLSYLSLAAYMKVNGELKAGDREKAGHFIRLYALVDPTNAEAPYLAAGWFMAQGKDGEALKSLTKAVDLGFSDLKRIGSDPAFTHLKGKPDYDKLIGRIKEKK